MNAEDLSDRSSEIDFSCGIEPCRVVVEGTSVPKISGYIPSCVKAGLKEFLQEDCSQDALFDGCSCEGNCLDFPDSCQCRARTGHFPYTRDGRLVEPEDDSHAMPIFECNSNCNCESSCSLRLVERGINVRLQIFETLNRGWGLCTQMDLPRGTFVCEYAGELLSQEEATRRWEFQEANAVPNYILSVREHL
jgi:hypothetical protein